MKLPLRPILTTTRTLAASAVISISYCLIAFAAISISAARTTTTSSCSSCYMPKSSTTTTIFYFATAFSIPLPSSRIFATSSSINKTASSTLFQRQVSTISSSSNNNNNSNSNTLIMAASSSTTSSTAAISPFSFMDYSPAYKSLVNHLRTISHLHHALSVLNYDRQVFMPTSDLSSMARGQQLATLASIAHEKSIDPQLGNWIVQAKQDLVKLKEEKRQQQKEEDTENSGISLKEDELVDVARLLELEQKSYHKQICIPLELAARKAELEASANHAWVKARKNNDFASFAPLLKDCFDTASEIANLQLCGGEDDTNNNISLYSQMLDEFEMGMSSERMDALFQEVQSVLVPFIAQIRDSGNVPSLGALSCSSSSEKKKRKFPIAAQKEASHTIVSALGFDNSRGRVDVSVHPFTMALSRHDVRITSRFNDEEWYQGLMGTIHEGGHAMYEQNLRCESDLSIDTALSMGVHESQSLFWERHIGKSKEFYKWAQPIMKSAFHTTTSDKEVEDGQGGEGEFGYSAEELYEAVNAVDFTNLIRVDADELTYPLHVILRYNIERDVIAGKLDVVDIPARWNKDMERLLGVHVPDDTRGCLQDIHWSCLAIGYFPTYLIGAMMAAQLSHYCHQDIPNMDNVIEEGKFDEIREWLRKKVHVHGKRYKSLDDLLFAEVGEQLNSKYFIDYLTGKYSDLYKI